jgi:hypothetical protein
MINSPKHFTGLGMPVFTAFGWAGEEAAIKFALTQLELFIAALHSSLPRSTQEKLPVYGLSQETQTVYLAANSDVESDGYIAFFARPMTFEIQLNIKDKKVVAKGLKNAEKEPIVGHRLITELGPEWVLRIQQMQVDEESSELSYYQDLFKDSVSNLDEETAANVMSKAAYLNSEEQWVTQLSLSRRFPSEQAAAMGPKIIEVMSGHIIGVMPVFTFLTGGTAQKGGRARPKTKPKLKSIAVQATPPEQPDIKPKDEFTYVSELKPLHLQRGFVNLTAKHWPFFALNSRTETRPVTVYYDGIYDRGSAVWRLLPNDQARLVLSPAVHLWIEEHFGPNDKIQVTAKKLSDEEIQVSLRPVEE